MIIAQKSVWELMALVPLIIFDPSFWAEDVHKKCTVKRLTLMDQEPGFNHLAEPLQARRTTCTTFVPLWWAENPF